MNTQIRRAALTG